MWLSCLCLSIGQGKLVTQPWSSAPKVPDLSLRIEVYSTLEYGLYNRLCRRDPSIGSKVDIKNRQLQPKSINFNGALVVWAYDNPTGNRKASVWVSCLTYCLAICGPPSLWGVHQRLLDGLFLVSIRECSMGAPWYPPENALMDTSGPIPSSCAPDERFLVLLRVRRWYWFSCLYALRCSSTTRLLLRPAYHNSVLWQQARRCWGTAGREQGCPDGGRSWAGTGGAHPRATSRTRR